MDAIILVGGTGTRLRPLTEHRHKSLVPICNRPAIDYLFDWVRGAGFGRAILALGQHNDDLAAAYPPGDHRGLQIGVVREHSRLESGGAIRHAVREAGVTGRFTVLNGDIFVDFDFHDALRAHQQAGAELTLALHHASDPSAFGVCVLDDHGFVTEFVEKPAPGTAPSNLINAGVWIFEPHIVDEIPPGAVRVEETLFPALVHAGRHVLGYRFSGPWEDIGVPARYRSLNVQLAASPEGRCIAQDASIARSATITRSVIGAQCRVGEHARIADSVLWESVRIGDGVVIESSVIADGCTIGDRAVIARAVLGARVDVPAGETVPPGASLSSETRYHGADER